MKNLAVILAIVLVLPGSCEAIGETLFQGGIDLLKTGMDSTFKRAVGLVLMYVMGRPSLSDWPTFQAIHDSFAWISGFFMLALMLLGIRYEVSADSPSGRASSKLAVQKMIAGMALVSLNGPIFQTGLDLSDALTNALIASSAYNVAGEVELAMLSATLGLACLLMPLATLFAVGLLVVVMSRYVLLLLLWAFFPLILAFAISQLSFLSRIGSRGVNLYIAAIISNPVVAVIFKISLDMLHAAADPSTVSWNVADKLLAFMMSIAGFAMACLSPFILLGMTEMRGAIATVAAGAAGAAAGGITGAAAGGVVTSYAAQGGSGTGKAMGDSARSDLMEAARSAEESLKRNAVSIAATQGHDGSSVKGQLDFMNAVILRQYEYLKADGVINEDGKGRINVGDGGKYMAKNSNLMGGYFEFEVPHGRGFGDERSRKIAEQQGLVSDGRIVMKNALQGVQGAHRITVNEAGAGSYNVAVDGGNKTTILTVAKCPGFTSRGEVIKAIQQESSCYNETPHRALSRISRGYDTINAPGHDRDWRMRDKPKR